MSINFSGIVAIAKNDVIGNCGAMPWRLPSDLRRFKQLTYGKPVIMGRKTWQSLPGPLKGRCNIVVSRSLELTAQSPFILCGSLSQAMSQSCIEAKRLDVSEIFIIGGAQIYEQSMAWLNRLYVTVVLADPDGDTYISRISRDNCAKDWQCISRQIIRKGTKDSHNSVFYMYNRLC